MQLPPVPVDHICDADGLLLRREALELGVDDNALARLVKSKVLVRIRHGAYCQHDVWVAADDRERHRLLCRAVMRQYAEHVVLSHVSACIVQGGPDWGLDLTSVHLTHLDGNGRKSSRIVHHEGGCRVGDLRKHEGLWVTTPARAVLETATLHGAEVAFVLLAHFLHAGMVTIEEVQVQAEVMNRWTGSLAHHPLLVLADSRLESVGEARTYFAFFGRGVPRPVPQFDVCTPDGTFVGRVDFAWPESRVLVEFDGLTKYHRFRRPGESIEQMVIREKRREDRLRELGWTVIRLVWSDLQRPWQIADRVRLALGLRAA